MQIAVLGTGNVGRTLGTALVNLGHSVTLGSRTSDNEAASTWATELALAPGTAEHATFQDAAADAELIINATPGLVSLAVLESVGPDLLADAVLLDVANSLDFSAGLPPRLAYCNTESLAERIQAAYPATSVVKSLSTVAAAIMVDPGQLPGDHLMFLAGNDVPAKETVATLLRDLGWRTPQLFDLGDLTAARGMEMYLPLWFRMYQTLGDGAFNITISR